MSKTDFKVGDIITLNHNYLKWEGEADNHKGVVTRVDEDVIYILWPDGSCGWHRDGKFYKKPANF